MQELTSTEILARDKRTSELLARAQRLDALLQKRHARRLALARFKPRGSTERKVELLQAAFTFLGKLSDSCYDDAMSLMVEYDGTKCDAYCLRQDIANELDIELE